MDNYKARFKNAQGCGDSLHVDAASLLPEGKLAICPLLWIGGTPLIYYFALFGDICVAVYCFVSGYAHYMQSSEAEIKKRWKHLLHFFIPFWVIAAVFSLIGLLAGNAEIPGSLTKFALNCLTIQNSYNGAWWYANTYILLVALQPLSRKFAERCPAWLVMLLTFGFYTAGYGIRFWGWGVCNSAVLSWVVTHIGLLGASYFPYMIGMLFCKSRSFLCCGSRPPLLGEEPCRSLR